MYADTITDSMKRAIDETNRRREIQMNFNKKHGIIPKSIVKDVRDVIEAVKYDEQATNIGVIDDVEMVIEELTKEMKLAAKNLMFERAAMLRDKIAELKEQQD